MSVFPVTQTSYKCIVSNVYMRVHYSRVINIYGSRYLMFTVVVIDVQQWSNGHRARNKIYDMSLPSRNIIMNVNSLTPGRFK